MPRPRKPKNLEARFEWYAPVIEADPASCAGAWAARHMPGAREVRLDLGCGKGSFALRSAAAEPDVLFVGMDVDRICVAMSAKAAMEARLPNVVFTQGDAEHLADYFAPGELARIHLNFCTPNPPAHDARRRLTHARHLAAFRPLLAPGAQIHFRTDSVPLFEYSLAEFAVAGYDVLWQTRDLRAERPDGITSEYEERLVAAGAVVHALVAAPGAHVPTPEEMDAAQEGVSQSLATYLPDDLDSLSYIPYGMEDTVRNLKNRRAKLAARAAREAHRAAGRS